ncbi:hypothetical protein [Sphingobium aquiterrae]|uniref:hypothetical protein n=1 Tax=Sphingobium aquiterrae TaxID=2038656 RepID=UPI00301AA11B
METLAGKAAKNFRIDRQTCRRPVSKGWPLPFTPSFPLPGPHRIARKNSNESRALCARAREEEKNAGGHKGSRQRVVIPFRGRKRRLAAT